MLAKETNWWEGIRERMFAGKVQMEQHKPLGRMVYRDVLLLHNSDAVIAVLLVYLVLLRH